jgi:predicted small secreted protein
VKKSLIVVASLAAALGLAACNTVEGAGKDVSSAGKAVSKTARDVKN